MHPPPLRPLLIRDGIIKDGTRITVKEIGKNGRTGINEELHNGETREVPDHMRQAPVKEAQKGIRKERDNLFPLPAAGNGLFFLQTFLSVPYQVVSPSFAVGNDLLFEFFH